MPELNSTEPLLLQQLAAGDAEAFCELFKHHWKKVYATALALTRSPQMAQDIAQEVFLGFWQYRDKADQIEKLDGFLFINTRNLIYKKMKRLKLEEAYCQYLQYLQTMETGHLKMPGELKELQLLVETGISKLPPQQQRAFRLSREQGLSHEEISRVMGVSRAAVKDYIVRANAFLRSYLGEHAIIMLGIYCTLLSS